MSTEIDESDSKVRIFILKHENLDWEAIVEIDTEKAADSIKEMVEFWMGWEGRLANHDGSYLDVFLLQLARELLQVTIECNLGGVASQFENREGWYPLNGTHGIKLIECDDFRFEINEFWYAEKKS